MAAMFLTKTVEPPNMEMNKLQLPLQLYLAGSLQPIRIDDVHVSYPFKMATSDAGKLG